MSTKDTFEKIARNTWLAGLGSIDSSKETLGKTIDAAQEKSNSLYDELVNRGEAIQNEISQKINKTRSDIESKGKELFGMSGAVSKSQDEKIADLNTKVDALTTAVVALIEKREADKSAAKKKAPAKSATKSPANDTQVKTKTKTVAKKPVAKKTTATNTKTASKTASKETPDKK